MFKSSSMKPLLLEENVKNHSVNKVAHILYAFTISTHVCVKYLNLKMNKL